MKLISTALSLDIEPTIDDIKKALSDIRTVEQDPFVILNRTEMTYLQAAYSNGSYVLECQYESTDKRFRAKGTFTHEAIEKAFELYFKGDTSWKQGIKFKLVNTKQPFIFKLGFFIGNVVEMFRKLLKHE